MKTSVALLAVSLFPAVGIAADRPGRVGFPVSLVARGDLAMRDNRVREPFYLELAAPVVANGRVVAPSGSIAVGEIVTNPRNNGVARKGDLAVRLLYISAPSGRLKLASASRDGLVHGDGSWIRSGTQVHALLADDVVVPAGRIGGVALASR